MSKRAATAASPGRDGGKAGSPKKQKTPPKKKKEEMIITQGEPNLIYYIRASGFKIWFIVQRGDRSDAFMKNSIDHIRGAQESVLRDTYFIKNDLTRRVSVERNEPMKNYRKAFDRKVFLQLVDKGTDTKEFDLLTAKEFQKVNFHASAPMCVLQCFCCAILHSLCSFISQIIHITLSLSLTRKIWTNRMAKILSSTK